MCLMSGSEGNFQAKLASKRLDVSVFKNQI